eukprot:COSAG01_NODE_29845_length_628_cov_1.069943_1_plen_33_part_10
MTSGLDPFLPVKIGPGVFLPTCRLQPKSAAVVA